MAQATIARLLEREENRDPVEELYGRDSHMISFGGIDMQQVRGASSAIHHVHMQCHSFYQTIKNIFLCKEHAC